MKTRYTFFVLFILFLSACGGGSSPSSQNNNENQPSDTTTGASTGAENNEGITGSDSGASTDSGTSSDSGASDSGAGDSGAGDESSSSGSTASDGLDDGSSMSSGSSTSTGSDAGSDSTSGDTTSGTTDDGTTDSGASDGGTSDGGSTTGGSTTSLPPDPADVAPTLDPTVTTTLGVASEFIYTGSNPIQTGVEEGTIDPVHVAVIRGKVFDKAGNPLSGVNITIHNHSEYGSTKTREDGVFDMVVNGGGYLTVVYQKEGYPTAHRKVDAPWQDYVWADDVVMVEYDTNVTTIDLSTSTFQVGEGSLSSDDDGDRTATVMFPAGTTATMVLEDGTEEPITTLNFRATEYTVGENGPESMPASLPANSAYTYAVELSVDEAVTAGATEITFNQPVYFYVENFLDFPVGEPVPTGYYDKEKSAWVPSDNGVIIEILGDEDGDGKTEIDSDGDGVADDESTLTDLGFTDEERETLASRYVTGQTLWRVGLEHFSSWDCNWPFGLPYDAIYPDQDDDDRDEDEDDSCEKQGSIIECQNQVLGEMLKIEGTPYDLNYRNNRTLGRKKNNTLNIQLTGDYVPPSLKYILLEISIEGKFYEFKISSGTNQFYEFEWDGVDGYGRKIYGTRFAKIRIGYVYDGVYGSTFSFGSSTGIEITGSVLRQEIAVWQTYYTPVSIYDQRTLGLGGWSITPHHQYDFVGKRVFFGSGKNKKSTRIYRIIDTIAGTAGEAGYDGDGGLATNALLYYLSGIVVDKDGNIYIADSSNNRIRKIDTSGLISTIAGTGTGGYSGDGGLAIDAKMDHPHDILVDEAGNLFFSDRNNRVIRKISTTGIITTIAGNGTSGYSGDGSTATSAKLGDPCGIALDKEGNLFIADRTNHVIRKVDNAGIITTIAGTGTAGKTGDGGSALSAELNYPTAVAIDENGNLIVSDFNNSAIRKISVTGVISTIAGELGKFGYSGDGSLAINAKLSSPSDVAIDKDGNIFVVDNYQHIIRVIDQEGIIRRVTGLGYSGFSGDEGPALSATLNYPSCVALDNENNLLICDKSNSVVRKVTQLFPGFDNSDIVVASEDGKFVYQFSSLGRHKSTINSFTGKTLFSFDYDSNNLLQTITDVDGNVTTVNRAADGTPISIVSPHDQITLLELDEDGYLKTITNPAGESYSMTYDEDGLLQSFGNPKGYSSNFEYDEMGNLTKDTNASGASQSFSKEKTDDGYVVTYTSAENVTESYLVETNSSGEKTWVNTGGDGLQTQVVYGADESISVMKPDGTSYTLTKQPDPRFGMQSPIVDSFKLSTPAGLVFQYITERETELSDSDNLLSLVFQKDTLKINENTYLFEYDADANEEMITTPELRTIIFTYNSKGDLTQGEITGLEPSSYTYDSNGRLSTITYGTTSPRTYTFDYYSADGSSKGLLKSITDSLFQTTSYEYDDAGRVTTQTEPDGRVISYNYDENGNLISITPPGKPEHLFTYNNLDLQSTYVAPDIGLSSQTTQYAYNKDKKIDLITRPDGKTIDPEYNSAGKLETFDADGEIYTYNYSSTTGQLTSVDDPFGGALTFTYDGSLLLSSTLTGDVTGSVSFTYDDNFWVTKQTINSSTNIDFAYDDDGLLTQAGSLSLTRSPDHGLITNTILSDVTSSIDYTEIGELESEDFSYAGSSIYSTTYTRDDLGRITDKTVINSGTTIPYSYTYDEAGRLETATYVSSTTTYAYDDNGNRLTKTKDGVTTIATYDDQDRLLTYGDNTYTYTDNGELFTKTNTDGTTTYTYNVLGNLKSVSLADGTNVEYVTDALARRVGKKVDGTLTQGFIYKDQLKPIAELDGSNNIVSIFIYGSKANTPDYMVKDGQTYRIISDQLGSPLIIIKVDDGSVVQELMYDEFGNILSDTNPGFQPFGFAGGIYDQHTKLTRFGARDYDAEAGRWTAKDPIGFDGGDTNLYRYVLNDPINLVDPSGHFGFEAVIVAGEGAAILGPLGVVIVVAVIAVAAVYIATHIEEVCPIRREIDCTEVQRQCVDKCVKEFSNENVPFGNPGSYGDRSNLDQCINSCRDDLGC